MRLIKNLPRINEECQHTKRVCESSVTVIEDSCGGTVTLSEAFLENLCALLEEGKRGRRVEERSEGSAR